MGNKISFIKLAGNVPDIAAAALEAYKLFLSVKYFAADSALKAVKLYQSKTLPKKSAQAAPVEIVNKDEIKTVKENTSMKKSTLFALLAFLAAAVAALVAVATYLKKKEENLREYEEMLFNEDYLADYLPKDDEECCCEEDLCEEEICEEPCCCCEEENEPQE